MKNYKTYSLLRKKITNFIFLFTTVLLFSCSKNNYPSSLPAYQFTSSSNQPDYKNLNYWAAHPAKKNVSDSVPKSLKSIDNADKSADVFFIYPTSLTDKDDARMNAPIDDSAINFKTDYSSILYQASVFNASCRVYAPRYRQAHIRAFYINQNEAAPFFDTAYADVKNAFLYYLQNENIGRPIIIASHSQGTKHAARLLKEFFDDKPLQNQLVCAYIIGLPVPENYFTTISACTSPDASGCVVSWRTYQRGYVEPNFVAKENFKAIVVNPLSWSMDTAFVSSKENSGGVLKNFKKIVPHVVDAQIHGNILWTSKPNVTGKIFLTNKNYHIGDINLFYMNIRENVRERIAVFRRK